ncbi:hypothetical protein MMIC_P1224 [Mariprofundus micogutta]|uniref:Uncharacterized protein n=1 Tax=Mariprofundus micogutta TaxID=1921010 RepID=A0A1L8CMX2_9PROT|nr:hypothetical protein [Mariprofundus micogutta]GAV20260.1 hypothetical protein MMIC_P1224 [Mariprofundus micogutta]
MNNIIEPVRHGMIMAVIALISGALWAAYMATHHEQLHSAFEVQQAKLEQVAMQQQAKSMNMDNMSMGASAAHKHDSSVPTAAHHDMEPKLAGAKHTHSGSLALDAMQRLLRGHIHFMGLGVLAAVLLLVTAFTSLKTCWKKVLGWTFGLGALAYPPAWILMGFRTVEMGPQAAEASIMWLFGPAIALLLASMGTLLATLLIEWIGFQNNALLQLFFQKS